MGSAFKCTTNALFFVLCFNKQKQLSVSTYFLKYTLSLSRQQPQKNNNKKSRQKLSLKKMQVQSVIQSLEFFFLANRLWRVANVAVNKKRAKVKPPFCSFLQALSSEKNLKHRSSPKAIEIRRNWQRHHKEHTLKPSAKFYFIPTSNGRWPGSWQTFQLDFLLPHFFRKK